MDFDSTEQLCNTYLENISRISSDKLNLMSASSIERGSVVHIEDSLLGLEEVNNAPSGDLVDLGTGNGFPGVPLAFATKRCTTLVDSRLKKIKAIEDALKEMNISYIETYSGRIEELSYIFPQRYAVATARALAQLSVLLELASPLLCRGGRLIAYKTVSTNQDNELQSAINLCDMFGMSFCSKRDAMLSDGSMRRLVVFIKSGDPEVKLPRRIGMAQNKPFI